MFKIKSLTEYITEGIKDKAFTKKLGLKKNKWEEIDTKKYKNEYELAKEFYELINIAYAPIGGHAKIQKPEDVFKDPKWDMWKVVDIDSEPDADVLVFGSKTPFGIKFSGVGHDGTKPARREYLSSRAQDLNKKGFYGEVSGKFAEILLNKYGVPTLNNEEDVRKILKGKDIEWHGAHPTNKDMKGSGWYTRKIGGTPHTKVIVGKPKI